MPRMGTLDGQVALVTGTSRGIGPAIAAALAAEGAHVLCHARTADAARRAAAAVNGSAVAGDLAVSEGVIAVARQVAALAPALHVLVHNAGVLRRGSAADTTREDVKACLDVNVLAPIELTRELLGPLRAAGHARVVVVSSTMGQLSSGMGGGSLPYRVSKAAVNAFVANTATELAPAGIIVNAMHPGWVRTDMGGAGATVTPEQAARTALYLAALPPGGQTGLFFRDCEQIAW